MDHYRHRFLQRESRRVDAEYQIETGGWFEPHDLTVVEGRADQGFSYVGTPARLIKAMLADLPSDLRQYTFVDLGSGKGRVLVLASLREFRRVRGVEFCEELHRVAERNISRMSHPQKRCTDVKSILADASRFEFPEEPLVVYFNNPFTEEVMRSVIENLTASYREASRPIILVYQQLHHGGERHRTRNLGLLADIPYLRPRDPNRIPDFASRLLLAPFVIRFFESPETRGGKVQLRREGRLARETETTTPGSPNRSSTGPEAVMK